MLLLRLAAVNHDINIANNVCRQVLTNVKNKDCRIYFGMIRNIGVVNRTESVERFDNRHPEYRNISLFVFITFASKQSLYTVKGYAYISSLDAAYLNGLTGLALACTRVTVNVIVCIYRARCCTDSLH